MASGEGNLESVPHFNDDNSSLSRGAFIIGGEASSGLFNTIGMNNGFNLKEYNQTRLQFINT
jgi:hypothetical protein